MAAWRLFIGLELPESYQEGLKRLRSKWAGRFQSDLSWTRPGSWHLTLKFLGDVAEERVPDLTAALSTVTVEPFPLKGGGGGYFPPSGRPKVMWVALSQGGKECARLTKRVETALVPLGFSLEMRPFVAHLTVARIKRPGKDNWAEYLRELHSLSWPETVVEDVVLWRSELTPEGPVYTELCRVGA